MKLFKLASAAVIIALTLCACSAGQRLNEMTVVQAVSLDRENGEVVITLQYLDLNKGSGKNEGLNSSLTANAQGRGRTLTEAVKLLAKTLPDGIFMGQAKLLVVGSSLDKRDMLELKSEFLRNNNIRPDMLLAKSEKGFDVLECGFRNERVPADGILKELKTEKKLVCVNDYLADSSVKLPEITVNGESGYVR